MTDTSRPAPGDDAGTLDDDGDDLPAPAATDSTDPVDLDAIERELDAVQTALDRLNDGTYWSDEVTGDPLPDALLAADPTARSTRATPAGADAPAAGTDAPADDEVAAG